MNEWVVKSNKQLSHRNVKELVIIIMIILSCSALCINAMTDTSSQIVTAAKPNLINLDILKERCYLNKSHRLETKRSILVDRLLSPTRVQNHRVCNISSGKQNIQMSGILGFPNDVGLNLRYRCLVTWRCIKITDVARDTTSFRGCR